MAYARRFKRGILLQPNLAGRSLSAQCRPELADNGPKLRTIIADVQHVVRATAESTLRRVAPPHANPAFQPRLLLGLLVYCYVTGTYSSADIAEMMRRDAAFRRLCRGKIPSARMLKQFRRKNRTAVRDCVYAVLRRQNQRCGLLNSNSTGTCSSDALEEDAVSRVLKAMFIDSVENQHD